MRTNKLILSIVLLLSFHFAKAQAEKDPSTYETGLFNVTVLPDIPLEGNARLLIGATDEMLNRYIPSGVFSIPIHAFMIETPDHTILVDAGTGMNLSGHLETYQKKAEDIDVILLTHLHGDHIGGLLKDGGKSFPAATLYVSQPEYDYWMNDQIMSGLPANEQVSFTHARNVLNAYQDQLHLFTPGEAGNSGKELLPGVQSIAAYGHTPGHTAYLLRSDGDQLLIWGDLTHAMDIQMPYPQIAMTYDTDPTQAIESRIRLLNYVSENNIRIAGMHIVYPGMGHITGSGSNSYSFTPVCTCEGMFR